MGMITHLKRFVFLPFLLGACASSPDVLSPKEELKIAEGQYYCSVSSTASLSLNADFTCVFSYIREGGASIEATTTFSMHQLKKDERYGIGDSKTPEEGKRVYRIDLQDPSIGTDSEDWRLRGMAKNLYLVHTFAGLFFGTVREIELQNENFTGPVADKDGNEIGVQPPLFWRKALSGE